MIYKLFPPDIYVIEAIHSLEFSCHGLLTENYSLFPVKEWSKLCQRREINGMSKEISNTTTKKLALYPLFMFIISFTIM